MPKLNIGRKSRATKSNTRYRASLVDVSSNSVEDVRNQVRSRTVQASRDKIRNSRRSLLNEAFHYDNKYDYKSDSKVSIGPFNIVCNHCQAICFKNEPKGFCCANGKVTLPQIVSPPDPLFSLVFGDCEESKQFKANMRKYNCCFQMTSFGAKTVFLPDFQSTFRIQGQIYHQIGSLLPPIETDASFLQIYFIGDPELESARRCDVVPGLNRSIVTRLQSFLHLKNNLVKDFKLALEKMPADNYKAIIRPDKKPLGEHERRYNEPIANEIAIVMVGENCKSRDIVLHRRNSSLLRISETHRLYDPLQYPLIFWNGQDSYHFDYLLINPETGFTTTKKVSALNFYRYMLMARSNNDNYVLKWRQLLNQFVVDAYAKIESERLLFIRLNQQKLRCDDYIHLQDAMQSDIAVSEIGKKVILPSTFIGSPRHMHEYTQDAMVYVRVHGRPDLFITVTCNPNWPEIKSQLYGNEQPSDRHDLISRIFKQKLEKLMDLIVKHKIFSDVSCWIYSIEWQKRGLPHAHILIWLKNKIRLTDMDAIISAEFPDKNIDPELFEIVSKHMIH